jgi:23S rRNA (adenine2503-C2)-methyltransferase
MTGHDLPLLDGAAAGSRPHALDVLDDRLREAAARHGWPAYRGRQIRQGLFARRARDWDALTDLPQAMRAVLATELPLWTATVIRHTQSDDGTEKLLLQLAAGGQIECVLLRGQSGSRTLCLSTQVGCAMGCVFCASGLDGVERNLTTGEIVEQMLRLQLLLESHERISHIVVMGMGEPLANLDRLLPALDEARREDGLGISQRRITISTVGLPDSIDRLARHEASYRLAISLHAPNDALRNELVPVNRRIGLGDILAAADRYFEVSGRRLTYEYVLLADVNDLPEHARELAQLLRGREALLNVIPYNPVAGLPYRTPTLERQRTFQTILEERGVQVRFRHRKGSRIDAACGQLRRNVRSAAGQ